MNSLARTAAGSTGRAGRGRQLDFPASHLWPAIVVAYAVLLPRELSINIAGAAFYPYRLALFAVTPLALVNLLRHPVRLHWIDGVAALASLWTFVALLVHEPLRQAIESGLALSLDFALAYLIGRAALRRADDLRSLFRAVLPGLLIVASILAVEAVIDQHLLRPFLAELRGLAPPEIHREVRLGLYRAAGPFPHPILGGVLLATLLPIAWFVTRSWTLRILGVAVASAMIFTVSTAAILAYLACAGLIAVYFAQRWSGLPLFLVAIVAAFVLLGAITLLSDSGLMSFIGRRLSLSPASGNWRILIWQYAGAEALRYPLFGIGLRDWARPVWMVTDSIDAHFLLWSVRFGLPAGMAVLLVLLGSAVRLLLNSRMQTEQARRISVGLSFALLAIVFSGFTVSLLEGVAAWMVMLSGMAVTLGTPPPLATVRAFEVPLRRRAAAASQARMQ